MNSPTFPLPAAGDIHAHCLSGGSQQADSRSTGEDTGSDRIGTLPRSADKGQSWAHSQVRALSPPQPGCLWGGPQGPRWPGGRTRGWPLAVDPLQRAEGLLRRQVALDVLSVPSRPGPLTESGGSRAPRRAHALGSCAHSACPLRDLCWALGSPL